MVVKGYVDNTVNGIVQPGRIHYIERPLSQWDYSILMLLQVQLFFGLLETFVPRHDRRLPNGTGYRCHNLGG